MFAHLKGGYVSKLLSCYEEESVQELCELGEEVDPDCPGHAHVIAAGVGGGLDVLAG